ncbi:MAG: PAS domain S-box protein [Lutibacter sp.]|uniref:PAS domain S-box protein n=1 Tax=Lutibacter sp. TaxID=1925666 RepID=UPI00299D31B7|nr:PAS domain S-box protein [Lutibacter sp.]MDX1828465.1 PAS domain S-box protein [Lutibacter sp.]
MNQKIGKEEVLNKKNKFEFNNDFINQPEKIKIPFINYKFIATKTFVILIIVIFFGHILSFIFVNDLENTKMNLYDFLLDSIFLFLLSVPLFYLFFIKPLKKQIIKRNDLLSELNNNKNSFHQTLSTIPNAVAITNMESGEIIMVNNQFQKLSGYSKKEIVGNTSIILNFWKDTKKREEYFNKLITKGKVTNFKATFFKKNNEEALGELSGTLINIDGTTCSINIIRDISEEVALLNKLKQSRLDLKGFFENDISADYSFTPEGQLINFNETFLKMFEFDAKTKAKSINVKKLHTNYEDFENIIKNIKKSDDIKNRQIKMVSNKGKEINVLVNKIGVFDSEGKLVLIRAFMVDITELKMAQEGITKMNNAIDNSTDVIFNTDVNGTFTFINKAFTNLYGYTPEEVIGKATPRILKGDNKTKEFYTQFWEKLKQKKSLSKIQFINKTKSGKLINIEASANTIFDENGENIGFLGIQRDITEQKKAEENLKLFRSLIDRSSDSIEVIDPKTGQYLDVNERGYLDLGYTKEELLKLTVFDIDPTINQKILEKINKKLRVSNGIIIEGIHRRKDGSTFPIEVNVKITKLDKEYLVSIVRDISERKNREKLNEIIQNITNQSQKDLSLKEILAFIQTELSKIVDTKNFFVALYNSKTDMITLPYYIDENDVRSEFPSEKTVTGIVIKSGKTLLIDELEMKQLAKDKLIERVGKTSKIWLGIPLIIEGKVTGAMVLQSYTNEKVYTQEDVESLELIAHQVSISIERKRHEEELIKTKEKAEESDQLKTEFLNNMSHEIRTPLNGILGFSDLLNQQDLNDAKRKNYINIIQNSSHQLIRIMDDILEISLLGTKKVTVQENKICLNDFLTELFSVFNRKAQEKELPLYLKKELSDNQSTIITDNSKLLKIMSNLLENALKFTNKGFIEIGYHLNKNTEPSSLEIYVKDSGIGIQKNKQQTIFKRFSQAEKELSKHVGGLGLGLSIAKENAELVGGKIILESKYGVGSTFTLAIPYNPVEIETEPETIKEVQTILIAEDDEINYIYLETLLQTSFEIKAKLIHAKNGLEAINFFKSNPNINLVFMDLKMPVLNGFEATKKLKEIKPSLPIIAISAYSTEEDIEKAKKHGCDDFLTKPYEADKIRMTLDSYKIV